MSVTGHWQMDFYYIFANYCAHKSCTYSLCQAVLDCSGKQKVLSVVITATIERSGFLISYTFQ